MRDRHKANTNNNHLTLERFQLNLHLSLEGYKHHFYNHLSLEGYHNEWKVITLGGLSQPKQPLTRGKALSQHNINLTNEG